MAWLNANEQTQIKQIVTSVEYMTQALRAKQPTGPRPLTYLTHNDTVNDFQAAPDESNS